MSHWIGEKKMYQKQIPYNISLLVCGSPTNDIIYATNVTYNAHKKIIITRKSNEITCSMVKDNIVIIQIIDNVV